MELTQDNNSPSSASKNNISTVRSDIKFGQCEISPQSPNFNTNNSEEESKFSTKDQTVTIFSRIGDSRNLLASRENQERESLIKEIKKIAQDLKQMATLEEITNYFQTSYQMHGKDVFNLEELFTSQHLKLKKYRQSLYFGEIQNEKRIGRGIMIYSSGRIYEGEWQNDLKFGKGFEQYPNTNRYEGQFVNGKPEGTGTYIWSNQEIYDGQWLNGMKHGLGMWKGRRGDSYTGEWRFGKADGYGVHIWINGDRYEGQFKGCLKHGDGTEKFANGDTYQGQYINGRPEGLGEYNWKNGSVYKGQFKNGLRHGKGVWKKSKTGVSDRYEGEYVNDKKCGYGEFQWASGNAYKGNYFDDLRHGYGEMYWVDGSYYKGSWDRGIQSGEGELYIPGEGVKKGVFINNVLTGNEVGAEEDQQNNQGNDHSQANFVSIDKENILIQNEQRDQNQLPTQGSHAKSSTQTSQHQLRPTNLQCRKQSTSSQQKHQNSLQQQRYHHHPSQIDKQEKLYIQNPLMSYIGQKECKSNNMSQSSNNSSRDSKQNFGGNKSMDYQQFETPQREKSIVSEKTSFPIQIRTFTKQRQRKTNCSYNADTSEQNKLQIDQKYRQQISNILSKNNEKYQQFYLRHTSRLPNIQKVQNPKQRYESDKHTQESSSPQDKNIQTEQLDDINQELQEQVNKYSEQKKQQEELSIQKRSISVQDKRFMTCSKETQTPNGKLVLSEKPIQICRQIYNSTSHNNHTNNFIKLRKSEQKAVPKNHLQSLNTYHNNMMETNYENYQFPKLEPFKKKLHRSPSPTQQQSGSPSSMSQTPLTKHEFILWNKLIYKLPAITVKQLSNYNDPQTIEKIRSYINPPIWKPAGILQSYTDFSPSKFALKKAFNYNNSNSNSNIKQSNKLA